MAAMPFDPPAPSREDVLARNRRAVALWLILVAAMVWVMVALGGATRLTGSGLSIMEWAPIRGILPPLSEAEWQRLYDLYRTIPQYELVNQGFGLAGFKGIFWLEWTHRFWGRMIGLVFAGGLAWFWARGRIPAGLGGRLVLLLVLGGLQGAVGWFMVASGFEADRTAVSPWRLVIHLALALVLYAVLVWTALGLLHPAPDGAAAEGRGPLRRLAHATAGLAGLTMLAGGFVAGIKAGFDYNTFPLMGGRLVPDGYLFLSPAWRNLFENVASVQFNHRLLATLTGLLAIATAWYGLSTLPRGEAGARRARWWVGALALATLVQYALGVAALVNVVPAWLGTLHQAMAVGVLTAALGTLHALRRPRGGPVPDARPASVRAV
ncbi:COX15/CtaA family protein [Roseomonas gilardii subsp. gilardii]|uniref:COX15/CtaA family protein n=1 Tax=Roseomonas gilardii TaxID=257708 RepID=UPI001FF9593B|nr:COX15/CtaA family protein [Roseomonas gilardii]UPG73772.1 COX15/CtaA family protein [Roseomonas gilardii subsp. gilardii]